MVMTGLRFDRVVSNNLVAALAHGGVLAPLVGRVASNEKLDLQLRREAKGRRSWVSVYAGLSSVLDVHERDGRFQFRAHPTYRGLSPFDHWDTWLTADAVANAGSDVGQYLDVILDEPIVERYTGREGAVHTAMSRHVGDYAIIQREAVVSFPDDVTRKAVVAEFAAPILEAVQPEPDAPAWWPFVRNHGVAPGLGIEVDLLGVDDQGRLLVIEAKPCDELKGITWSPAQVRVYAALFRRLAGEQHDLMKDLRTMLAQRAAIGLLEPPMHELTLPLRIAPVVAIGPGKRSPEALSRLHAIESRLSLLPHAHGLEPLEVWLLDEHGAVTARWFPASEPPPDAGSTPSDAPSPEPGGTFVAKVREAAVAWKLSTGLLPDDARVPAPYNLSGPAYEFCLPLGHELLNLLPEAREVARTRFAEAQIHWHRGRAGLPTNHLVSSQVQCLNALAPMVDRPDLLRSVFGAVLPIAEVIPFGTSKFSSYEATDHIVFEWIGLHDYLGERPQGSRKRGANTTSADAAFRYRNHEGKTELALVEWKYTEQYRGNRLGGDESSMKLRHDRYRELWDDPQSPVRLDLIPYADLFVEPFYQLMRQQLLAWRMEAKHELAASTVRVVVVHPGGNTALLRSFNRASQRWAATAAGDNASVYDAWRSMLRRPDRFCELDSETLLAPDAPTTAEYKSRYTHGSS